MATNSNGYTDGYTKPILGRKGTAVMYIESLRRARADKGVRDAKAKE